MEFDVALASTLLDVYAKCACLNDAEGVFNGMPQRNFVSWNALMIGHVQQGNCLTAMYIFKDMQHAGMIPTKVTFLCIIRACCSIKALGLGKEIHNQLIITGFDVHLDIGNALIDMYAKCQMLEDARKVFDNLVFQDHISWGSMVVGYVQHGHCTLALSPFEEMQRDSIELDKALFSSILKACGTIGAFEKGKKIHDELIHTRFLKESVVLGNVLVDMYARFGLLAKAHQVLENLTIRDVVSWTTIIAGYGQKGQTTEALNCFDQMLGECIAPNEITLLSVLAACSHSGKMNEAQIYYENMSKQYGVTPQLEHHTCMVAILGCAGHLGKAMAMIKTMISSSDPSVWLTLLYYCKKWGNVKLGRLACHQTIQYDFDLSASYVLMSNIHAAAGIPHVT